MPVVINSNTINDEYKHESLNDVTSINDTIRIENVDLNLNKILHNKVQPFDLNSNNVKSLNIDVNPDNLVISPCDEALDRNMESLIMEKSGCFPPMDAMDNLNTYENIEEIFVFQEHDDENNIRENLVNIKKNNYMYFYNDCCVLM